MRNHSVAPRGDLSRSERHFIMRYMPAAFAAGSLIGAILMMVISLMGIMPDFLGFSLHGVGFALVIAIGAILFEQLAAGGRTQGQSAPCTLRDARRRCLMAAGTLGAIVPSLINLLLKL